MENVDKPDTRPDWLKNHIPDFSNPGNPAWKKGMKSPNPNGRPKGVSKKTLLTNRMLENSGGIVDRMIKQALEGDSQAATIILSRIIPALRAQAEKVVFDFDAAAPTSKQVEQVLQGTAEGQIAPDVAKQIIEAINSLSQIRATEELEARIVALEAKEKA
ncbi:DUF5681 domain-containing protein [Nitrosospira multiformis]|uniref:DUF5681 domain-containing protein n=1 Tax=Nitrosospira multiformis TaxID=1231 RepID=A0A1I7IWA9_9PROT|nr:DUF5681 domain-containing protein [Nitrosospira multiformis]SFU77189.1 hypothetical protein SAMN05216417_1295 [Nitrosospira multiformis]